MRRIVVGCQAAYNHPAIVPFSKLFLSAFRRISLLVGLAMIPLSAFGAGTPTRSIRLAPSPVPQAADWLQDLDAWLGAVDSHRAGRADEAARSIAPWSLERLSAVKMDLVQWREGLARAGRLASANVTVTVRGRRFTPAETLRLFRITEAERRAGDLDRVIRRGAMLHADIAAHAGELPASPGGVIVTVADGRQTVVTPGTRHLGFGCDLVAILTAGPGNEAFAHEWYRATSADLQRGLMITLADQHLTRALVRVSNDADLLFRAACAVETLSAPRVQAESRSIDLPPGYRIDVESPDKVRARSLKLFRQSLALSPDRGEAQVRFAHLLGEEGLHDEAIAVLRQALAAPLDATVRYLAWLFLGRAEEAVGGLEEARQAYENASSAMPEAQSPLVALAHLARVSGNHAGLASAMERWWSLPRRAQDPWSRYYLMQGADAESLFEKAATLAGEGQ